MDSRLREMIERSNQKIDCLVRGCWTEMVKTHNWKDIHFGIDWVSHHVAGCPTPDLDLR